MASIMRGLRPVAARIAQQPARQSTRKMGGGPVDPSTLPWPDSAIRSVLKYDWQVVLAILGMYTGLTLVAKGLSGGKKDAAPAVAAASTGAFPPTGYKSGTEPGTAGVPSFTDANFEAWAAVPGNMAKWEAEVSKM